MVANIERSYLISKIKSLEDFSKYTFAKYIHDILKDLKRKEEKINHLFFKIISLSYKCCTHESQL